jgi:alkanesulfonate monooxygenase SsuD/methylene tetrahydromethanopterin reductase-like flavin-dependent oxidoreductase (luciferase family)
LHDIRELDGRGIPGGFVASEVFRRAADSQGESLGFHPDSLFVPHPIQDRTDEELRALADASFPGVLALIAARA